MSDISYITYFLDIPGTAISLLTIIYSTYFTCIYNSNSHLLIQKAFLYLIIFQTILFKKLATVCRGTGSSPNPKQASSHTPLISGFLRLYIVFFRLVQLYSFNLKVLFYLADGSSNSLVTVNMYCSAGLSAPDPKGINYQ